jgi:hypothetical protein
MKIRITKAHLSNIRDRIARFLGAEQTTHRVLESLFPMTEIVSRFEKLQLDSQQSAIRIVIPYRNS